MAATDISKVGNTIQVTPAGGQPSVFAGFPITYSFDAAGAIFNLSFGINALYNYAIALADLRLAGSGTAPANAAAAITSLSTIVGTYP